MKPVTSPLLGSMVPASLGWGRRRRNTGDGLDQFRHAEILQRRTKEHRRQIAMAIGFQIELGITRLPQFDFLGKLLGHRLMVDLAQKLARIAFGTADATTGEVENALKRPPMPTGHDCGDTSSASASATSSRISKTLRPSRSTLLTKVMIGTLRKRQTSNSLRVCGSIPLAASITMMAESTAVSVR
jgi:hypothetical protein